MTDRRNPFQGMVYANTMNTTPARTAGICSWSTPSEFNAFYLSMFNVGSTENFTFSFDKDSLTFTIKGRQKDIILHGTMQK